MAEPELTAWLCVFVEDDEIRFMEQIADGMDASEVHAAQTRALKDALAGRYAPGGVARPLDLDSRWWQLRAVVNGTGDYAGLGGGPLSKPYELLRTVKTLAEAALYQIAT